MHFGIQICALHEGNYAEWGKSGFLERKKGQSEDSNFPKLSPHCILAYWTSMHSINDGRIWLPHIPNIEKVPIFM